MDEKLKILLIEDEFSDVLTVQKLLKDHSVKCKLNVIRDGEQAFQFVKRGVAGCKDIPDIILLDLSLPKIDGIDVLKEIKNSEEWKSIPVIVLSTFGTEYSIIQNHGIDVEYFLSKPITARDFLHVLDHYS